MALLVYDCQGETFEFPEVVPFRLTHNMVDAMGPMGYEGLFRRACGVCTRLIAFHDLKLKSSKQLR